MYVRGKIFFEWTDPWLLGVVGIRPGSIIMKLRKSIKKKRANKIIFEILNIVQITRFWFFLFK